MRGFIQMQTLMQLSTTVLNQDSPRCNFVRLANTNYVLVNSFNCSILIQTQGHPCSAVAEILKACVPIYETQINYLAIIKDAISMANASARADTVVRKFSALNQQFSERNLSAADSPR